MQDIAPNTRNRETTRRNSEVATRTQGKARRSDEIDYDAAQSHGVNINLGILQILIITVLTIKKIMIQLVALLLKNDLQVAPSVHDEHQKKTKNSSLQKI